jgi:mannitol/fructose-specific phosphotransferase system IIA component (Ntr-type)
MRLQEILHPADVIVGLEASDKWDCLGRMMDHLVRTERIPGELSSDLLEAILARERSMSTGMEHGIAIPHAAVEGLDELVGCLAIAKAEEGINFESIDASPTHLIVLLLIPRAQKLLHIRTLAGIARVLGDEAVRSALLKATGEREAWRALAGKDQGGPR